MPSEWFDTEKQSLWFAFPCAVISGLWSAVYHWFVLLFTPFVNLHIQANWLVCLQVHCAELEVIRVWTLHRVYKTFQWSAVYHRFVLLFTPFVNLHIQANWLVCLQVHCAELEVIRVWTLHRVYKTFASSSSSSSAAVRPRRRGSGRRQRLRDPTTAAHVGICGGGGSAPPPLQWASVAAVPPT